MSICILISWFKNNVDCRLDQYSFICQEMSDLMARGVRNVIEMTNRYMGAMRNLCSM